MKKISHKIKLGDSVNFNNNAAVCVGTGRMNLALRHEYHKQLEKTQKDIGFTYIRGHGLFCDDMAVYHTYEEDGAEKEEYNFKYIDLVFDDYLSLGIKPFVEFGFMPKKMASGEQTIFWWKGNVTPPSDYGKWERLIKATVTHWIKRYGEDEVSSWYFEVWNEPNLRGFWKDADMEEYFKLYEVTARAVKQVCPRLRIGGPAICGVDDERWLRLFLEFCRDNKVPLDIVTRHAYATELPEHVGHYAYQDLRPPEVFLKELDVSRGIIDSFPEYKGAEMHITEFNTSYTPLNPIHDNNLNAAFVARLLSEMGDTCASYSYWTFGDVFEEAGVSFTPFSGCFGLLTNGSVPKPTYHTFVFFKDLYEQAIARTENYIITKSAENNLRGIAWNIVEKSKNADDEISLNLSLEIPNGEYFMFFKKTDEKVCNPLKVWLDMGSPAYPSGEQLEILKICAQPQIETKRISVSASNTELDFTLPPNAVYYFELTRVEQEVDRGFDKTRIQGAN